MTTNELLSKISLEDNPLSYIYTLVKGNKITLEQFESVFYYISSLKIVESLSR